MREEAGCQRKADGGPPLKRSGGWGFLLEPQHLADPRDECGHATSLRLVVPRQACPIGRLVPLRCSAEYEHGGATGEHDA
jgi:hypothetical protein